MADGRLESETLRIGNRHVPQETARMMELNSSTRRTENKGKGITPQLIDRDEVISV